MTVRSFWTTVSRSFLKFYIFEAAKSENSCYTSQTRSKMIPLLQVVGESSKCLSWALGSNGLKQSDYTNCTKSGPLPKKVNFIDWYRILGEVSGQPAHARIRQPGPFSFDEKMHSGVGRLAGSSPFLIFRQENMVLLAVVVDKRRKNPERWTSLSLRDPSRPYQRAMDGTTEGMRRIWERILDEKRKYQYFSKSRDTITENLPPGTFRAKVIRIFDISPFFFAVWFRRDKWTIPLFFGFFPVKSSWLR